MRRIGLLLAVLSLALSLPASGAKEEPDGFRIGAVLPNSSEVFWEGVWKGIEKGAEENNVRLSPYFYPVGSKGDMEKQLDKVLLSKLEGIILASNNLDEDCGELLAKARDDGVKVVFLDFPSADYLYDASVTLDNTASGKRMAEELLKRSFSQIVILTNGSSTVSGATESRIAALAEALEEGGAVYTVDDCSPEISRSHVIQGIINSYPEGTCFVCPNSHLTLITAQAIDFLGAADSTFLAGWCEEPEAFRHVSAGVIDLLAAQDMYGMGKLSVDILAGLLSGKEVEKTQYIDVNMVDADNLEDLYEL